MFDPVFTEIECKSHSPLVCLSAYPPVYLSIYVGMYIYTYLPVCPSIYHSIRFGVGKLSYEHVFIESKSWVYVLYAEAFRCVLY
jgi:hypothetical protein